MDNWKYTLSACTAKDKPIYRKTQRIKSACGKCAYRENQQVTDDPIRQRYTGTGRNTLIPCVNCQCALGIGYT